MTSQNNDLLPCPFCGGAPHRGPGKVYHDQLHGEPMQDFGIWCPRGHAKITMSSQGLAIKEWNTRASPAPADGVREALPGREEIARLITTAKLLLQNAEGCAVNHYGFDFDAMGYPGWLADCRKDIEAAMISAASQEQNDA